MKNTELIEGTIMDVIHPKHILRGNYSDNFTIIQIATEKGPVYCQFYKKISPTPSEIIRGEDLTGKPVRFQETRTEDSIDQHMTIGNRHYNIIDFPIEEEKRLQTDRFTLVDQLNSKEIYTGRKNPITFH